ncbi:DUF6220 domain-containing protein [Paenibacillus sp. VCA1]|uniref:DUF6220 domain-containing protein n=1 Tax=Paenibacillus sp. VCA1 TaxID=3039148 RepID=UPI0028719CCC|nr:DUF6220 domain-containing protein [Paenibacillus sp. VCA1]MDR9852220.1 DUF6220 domain-containing protein [Paenibacillus sp. VCA1]
MSNLSLNSDKPKGGDPKAEISNLSPLAIGMRLAYKAMVWLFAIGIMIQIFLAGLALFWNSAQWASHIGFSRVLIILPVLIFAFSFIAKLPRSLCLHSAGLIALVVLIAVCAKLPSGVGYLSALHPVLAIMLFGQTMNIARKAQALTKAK